MVVLAHRRRTRDARRLLRPGSRRPRRALTHFAATTAYAAECHIRDHALFLTRAAQAHLALGDIDQACAIAHHALDQSNTVDSTRLADALTDLRSGLSDHGDVPAVRDFLDRTA